MRFMVFHTLEPGMPRERVVEIQQATQEHGDIRGYRSFLNLTEGKAVCIYDAPDKEQLVHFFRKLALPYESISLVELEGEGGEIHDVTVPEVVAADFTEDTE